MHVCHVCVRVWYMREYSSNSSANRLVDVLTILLNIIYAHVFACICIVYLSTPLCSSIALAIAYPQYLHGKWQRRWFAYTCNMNLRTNLITPWYYIVIHCNNVWQSWPAYHNTHTYIPYHTEITNAYMYNETICCTVRVVSMLPIHMLCACITMVCLYTDINTTTT